MLKANIRKQALEQRKSLTSGELVSLSLKLLVQFKSLDFDNIKSVHIFLPIAGKKEPETFLIIDWLQENHKEIEIVVSKSDFESNLMSHYSYLDKADLINNRYHIPEPQKAKPFVGVPSMVIVPLLAFDQRGYRVGYGRGFYDRFLQHINTLKIGLSLFDEATEINDVHLNDIRLDKCITPTCIYTFGD